MGGSNSVARTRAALLSSWLMPLLCSYLVAAAVVTYNRGFLSFIASWGQLLAE
jgi:hypothetical protein